jgi:hypothetical protein
MGKVKPDKQVTELLLALEGGNRAVLDDARSPGASCGPSGPATRSPRPPWSTKLMREVRHPVELGRFLCFRGELELDCSNLPSAKAALEEVESIAAARGWDPESEIGDLIAKLRDAVNRDRA